MKQLFIFTFLLLSLQSFSQIITAPAPLTIEANASNVDAGDFVVNWANNTDQLLISISLDYHNGATFSLPINTGLNFNTGYTSWTSISSIVFYGTKDNINNALASMTISTTAMKTAIKISIEVTNYDANYKYNPVNKHFYRYVSGNVTYSTAKTNAGSATYNFKGKTGYLVTITSQSEQDFINNNITGSNLWIALSDAATTTDGTWMIDAGPESGTILKTQNGPTAGNIDGQYNNWCNGEPNGVNHSEDYAVTKWNGGNCWNDLPNSSTAVAGYIVEISADFPAGTGYTDVYTSYVVHNNEKAFTRASSTGIVSNSISNIPNLFGGLQVNDGHTITLRAGYTINSNRLDLVGTGKIVFTDATTKWTPGKASSTNSIIHSPSTNSNPIYWTQSSVFSNNTFNQGSGAYHLTPWLNSLQGWSAASNDANQYITLNYDVPTYISGIVIQDRFDATQRVSAGHIDVSLDNVTWTNVVSSATFNSSINRTVSVLFPSVHYAKYVRIRPTNWDNTHITLRFGLILKTVENVSDGLVLDLDASNQKSYIGSGTVWNDLSENSSSATLSNVTYSSANGGYLVFNGTNSYVNFNANIGSTSVVTVEIWVKTIALGGMFFGFDLYDVIMSLGNLGFNTAVGEVNGIPSAQVTTLGILNKWKHLVFVMNQGTITGNKIYVNGVSQLLSYSNGAANTANATFNSGIGRISSWRFNLNYLANMQLGNFRVYKRELTQQEISDNFVAQKTRFGL